MLENPKRILPVGEHKVCNKNFRPDFVQVQTRLPEEKVCRPSTSRPMKTWKDLAAVGPDTYKFAGLSLIRLRPVILNT